MRNGFLKIVAIKLHLMKTNIFLSILCFTLCLSACKNSNDDLIEVSEGDFLSQLSVGDEIRYIFFDAESYWDSTNFNFSYQMDTLVLRVDEINDDGVVISESLTEGSEMLTDSTFFWANESYKNTWEIENDTLIITPKDGTEYLGSILFFRYVGPSVSRIVSLPMIDFEEETEVQGWKTTWPYTETNLDLFAQDATILGHEYDRLNIAIRNISMTIDGPGATYMYGRMPGVVRTSTYSWWTSEGVGWDKI